MSRIRFVVPSLRIASIVAACLLALPAAGQPKNFVYLGQDELDDSMPILNRSDISGAEIMYAWSNLEPEKGKYDFSMIEHDLAFVRPSGKALYIEVLDRFFQPGSRLLPRYLLESPEYSGGLSWQGSDKPRPWSGWVAQQWNPLVRKRFQALLKALANRFDGRIAGRILTETAASIDYEKPPAGWSCDSYYEGTLANALTARRAFRHSNIVQYANFWPCEGKENPAYMRRFFDFAAANHIGVGGPDIVPWNKGLMLNSYPFIRVYRDKIPLVALAVQEPTLEYFNPETNKPFTRVEFTRFAYVYLRADVIFWSKSSPWLTGPIVKPE